MPKKITYRGTPVAKTVVVSLQNHSTQAETISSAAQLARAVRLTVDSLGACADLTATIISPSTFPITITPKGKLTIVFKVAYNCANDPLATSKTAFHADYRYVATVDGTALGWTADADSNDSACPHDPPPGGIDPVNPVVKDKACGGKNPDKTLGANMYTDVVVK